MENQTTPIPGISGFLKKAGMAVFLVSAIAGMLSGLYVGLMLLCFLFFLLSVVFQGRSFRLSAAWPDLPLIVFVLFTAIIAIFARQPVNAIFGTLAIFSYFLVMQVFRHTAIGKKDLQLWTRFLGIGILAFCAFCLVHYFLIRTDLSIRFGAIDYTILRQSTGMLVSLLEHPTRGSYQLSIFLIPLIAVSALEWEKLGWPDRILRLLALTAAVLVIALAAARVGLMVVGVSVFASLLLSRRFKLFGVVLGVSVAILALFLVLRPPASAEPARTDLQNLKSRTIDLRLNQYRRAWDIFKSSNPATGIGLLNFHNEENRPDSIDFIHNTYLAILTETGIAGFLLFFGFAGWAFVIFTLKAWKTRAPGPAIGAVAFLAFFASSLTDGGLIYVFPLALAFWSLLGLAGNPALGNAEKQSE